MREDRSAKVTIAIFVVSFLVGGALFFFILAPNTDSLSDEMDSESADELEQDTADGQEDPQAPIQSDQEANLPEQNSNRYDDSRIRKELKQIADHRSAGSVLATKHLVAKFAAIVENVANGNSPRILLDHLRPDKRFSVQAEKNDFAFMDPASYQRYDTYADIFCALDAKAVAAFLERIMPAVEQSHRELGKPGRPFRKALAKAVKDLLAVPVPKGKVGLERIEVTFRFRNPELEKLTDAQKHFLRMGPKNVARVQAKIRQIAKHLQLPTK